jgi:uncharacterized coiled-coil DUF342 family protein
MKLTINDDGTVSEITEARKEVSVYRNEIKQLNAMITQMNIEKDKLVERRNELKAIIDLIP